MVVVMSSNSEWQPGTCPVDGQRLVNDAGRGCLKCGGSMRDAGGLPAAAMTMLQVESSVSSPAYQKVYPCSSCGVAMVPWRIGDVQRWLYKCNSCEGFWVGAREKAWWEGQMRQGVARAAYQSLGKEERDELRTALIEQAKQESGEPELSPLQKTMAAFGMPSVVGARGGTTPWGSWGLALVLLLAFLVVPAESAAYRVGEDGLGGAVSSLFAHFGWFHLLGNVYFLAAFGAGAEQRLRWWGITAVFLVTGTLACFAESVVAPTGSLIGGASGSVSAVMGVCFILQARAKVLIGIFLLFRFHFFRVPMLAFALFEILYQVSMATAGSPGVAWTAHLVGLGLGVGVGAVYPLRDLLSKRQGSPERSHAPRCS